MKTSFLLIFTFLFVFSAFSQNKSYKNEIGFQTDNDGFLGRGSDRYYTAGNFLYFNHALKITDTSHLANKVLGFELGQKIYTPHSGDIPDPAFLDRPFAGYLYIGSTLNLLYKDESNLKLEVQTGVIGPSSQAQEVQDLIHKTFGFYTPDGWQYQIHNNFEINLAAQYNRLIIRDEGFDLSVNTYADLGTGLTGAGAGATLRFGEVSPLFNSIITSSTVSSKNKASRELFFYYKPVINYIAYNATIQGGLFEKTPAPNEITKTIEPFVFSQQVGGDLVMGHWVIDASAIFESNDTKDMLKTEQWGSLSVLYRFH